MFPIKFPNNEKKGEQAGAELCQAQHSLSLELATL